MNYFKIILFLGGINENLRVLKYFKNLRSGQRMLDIGVGIGGGARQVAKVKLINFFFKLYCIIY